MSPVEPGGRRDDVYRKLLENLAEARSALGGEVYDMLGRMQFDGKPLRELLISSIATLSA